MIILLRNSTEHLLKVIQICFSYCLCSYGDKTVVSIPARIFTVIWTLFGLVTFGIMMGSLSAALETMTFEETGSNMMLYGTQVFNNNRTEHINKILC
jgi:hypothetical protein